MSRSPGPKNAGRLTAMLHTNIFSLGDVIGTLRGDAPWWPVIIENAGLPGEPAERIRSIVKRTRLWNHERREIARELCSHAAEALEAGRTPNEVAASLGTPRTVARLLRRAMKRKRPITWQIRAWTMRGLGTAACVVLLIAGFMTARFFVGSPTVTRNFIAEMNAPIDRLAEDEKAWPLLKEAFATFAPKRHLARVAMEERATAYQIAMTDNDGAYDKHAYAGIGYIPRLPAGHPDTDAVMALYRDIQGELEMMREASSRPSIGMRFSTKHAEMPGEILGTPEAYGWMAEPLPESDDPADQEMVIGVLLPSLGAQRSFAKWFAFDARVKIAEGNADGAVESIEAMLGLADQCAHDHFLIGYLVAIAIEHLAVQAVSDMMTVHGDALGDDDLVRLAHLLGAPRLGEIPLEGEEIMFEDFLQRAFTDDGNGDGHLTNEGMRLLRELEGFNAQVTDGIVESFSAVKQVALVAPRAEQRRVAERVFARFRAEAAAGYGIYRDTALASGVITETLDKDRFRTLRLLLPAVGNVLSKNTERRARVEACLVGIAAELYRRETGAWPVDVTQCVPLHLPFAPEDPVTGEPIAIAPGEHTITVYSMGPDGDDDGGRMDPDDESAMRPEPRGAFMEMPGRRFFVAPPAEPGPETPDGDWVLFPVPG